MTNIDLAIIMPAPEEPEHPVRAHNKADDAWAIQQKARDIAWTKIENSAATLEYFQPQVSDHQRYHFRCHTNDYSRISHRY